MPRLRDQPAAAFFLLTIRHVFTEGGKQRVGGKHTRGVPPGQGQIETSEERHDAQRRTWVILVLIGVLSEASRVLPQ